jgi:hypothetical protein
VPVAKHGKTLWACPFFYKTCCDQLSDLGTTAFRNYAVQFTDVSEPSVVTIIKTEE